MNRRSWLCLSLMLGLQACTIKVSDSEDPRENLEARRGAPEGVALEQDRPKNGGFTTPSFTEGPELGLSRNTMRALQEADIVQVSGDRLYAMSRAAGFYVIDISNPDALAVLGHHRSEATPFEMFVRGDTIVALYREAPSEEPGQLVSRIVSLDVSNPENITETSSLDVPGEISEGRILDNVLYIASYQQNCWRCPDTPGTVIMSIDVSDASELTEVDRESFNELENESSWTRRSVSISDERMYVSGRESSGNSVIQVIDVSDTSGDLELGAQVQVEGDLFSRWQVDEYLGVLRVISQQGASPIIQTFMIEDSSTITALGRTAMVIPERESLRSVRFDGERAFAITYERTDPLFGIDLSDPANPAQVGELHIPGFVYHMEIRGDRIYGMGFEVDNDEGGLHVSLFDVSDLENPTMLDRVNFGPTWPSNSALTEGRYLVEDHNRIHQVFKVLDDLGTILVPYHGWSEQTEGCGTYSSGVQIVDFTADDLTKRGAAPASGAIRRALIHNERLIGVSEQHVDSFDISDKDAPAKSAHLPLTLRAHRAVPIGDRVLRIHSDWWTHVAKADIVELADVESPVSAGSVDLAAAISADRSSCSYHDDSPFQDAPAFAFGDDHVVLAVVRSPSSEEEPSTTEIISLNVAGTAPTIAAQLTLNIEPLYTGLGRGVAKVGDHLVLQRPGDNVQNDHQDVVLEVVDLSDPSEPRHVTSVARPLAWSVTGLYLDGTESASGFYTFGEDDSLQFFLDRVSFSDTGNPSPRDVLEIPGLLVGRMADNFVTVDFLWHPHRDMNSGECAGAAGDYDELTNICWLPSRPLRLLSAAGDTLATAELPRELVINAALDTESTLFLAGTQDTENVVFVSGTQGAELRTSSVQVPRSFSHPVARGTDLYFFGDRVVQHLDASDPGNAVLSRIEGVSSFQASHLALTDNQALLSGTDQGIQVIDLP